MSGDHFVGILMRDDLDDFPFIKGHLLNRLRLKPRLKVVLSSKGNDLVSIGYGLSIVECKTPIVNRLNRPGLILETVVDHENIAQNLG